MIRFYCSFFCYFLFSFIGSGYYLQIVYIRKMAALKMQNGWLLPKRPLLIDTQLVLNKTRNLFHFGGFTAIILTFVGAFIPCKRRLVPGFFLNYCFDVKFVHWRLLFYCALTCQTAN